MNIENIIRTIENKGVVIGTCITETGRNPQIARIFANFGFDFLIIECEHGSYSIETASDLITMAKLSGVAPFVKIGEYSYHTFARYLDAGADGFILPRVRKKDEVAQVMEWINYYPDGVRGYSPGAPHCNYGFDIENSADHRDFIAAKNSSIFIVIQFETKEAIENADEILSVPGVDSVVTGPCDLSMSLGCAGDVGNPLVKDSVKKVFDACKKHNVAIGNTAGDLEEIKKQLKEGLQFIWYKNDYIFLQSSQKELETVKALF